VALIREAQGDAVALTVDVAAEDSVDRMSGAVARIADKLDVLINNAGVASVPARLLYVLTAEWDRVNAINLRGPFLVPARCCRRCSPRDRRQEQSESGIKERNRGPPPSA